jgi:hypothetical protein
MGTPSDRTGEENMAHETTTPTLPHSGRIHDPEDTLPELRRLLTAVQVAEIFSLTKHRVYEATRLGLIPHVRIGRQLRYDPFRIREWLDGGGTGAGS